MLKFKTTLIPAALITAALVAAGGTQACAQKPDEVKALKEEIAQLQAKVVDMEKRLAAKNGQPVSMADDDYGYDPFAQMDAMERQMQALMAYPFGRGMGYGPMLRAHMASFAPDYDVKASDKAYTISFDMPGMDKSKINVEVKDGTILVSGERSSETKEDQPGKFYRQERSFGYFSRSIPLPEDARPESLQAKYDNGVLTLTLDKKEAKKAPAKQKIEVK